MLNKPCEDNIGVYFVHYLAVTFYINNKPFTLLQRSVSLIRIPRKDIDKINEK